MSDELNAENVAMTDDDVLKAVRGALADAETYGVIEPEEFIRLLREHYGYEVRRIDGTESAS